MPIDYSRFATIEDSDDEDYITSKSQPLNQPLAEQLEEMRVKTNGKLLNSGNIEQLGIYDRRTLEYAEQGIQSKEKQEKQELLKKLQEQVNMQLTQEKEVMEEKYGVKQSYREKEKKEEEETKPKLKPKVPVESKFNFSFDKANTKHNAKAKNLKAIKNETVTVETANNESFSPDSSDTETEHHHHHSSLKKSLSSAEADLPKSSYVNQDTLSNAAKKAMSVFKKWEKIQDEKTLNADGEGGKGIGGRPTDTDPMKKSQRQVNAEFQKLSECLLSDLD